MKIKICGITCTTDLNLAVALGADYLGFIQYPKSPRFVPESRLKEMLFGYSGAATPILVFVNETVGTILSRSELLKIKTVQLHGEEAPEMVSVLKKKGLHVIKALPIKDAHSLESSNQYDPDFFLLDTHHPDKRGGTGVSFDWALLRNQELLLKKSFVAGGITADSVPGLLKQYEPWGLDVSSGVESEPGKKDPQKMRNLFDQVKEFYAKLN